MRFIRTESDKVWIIEPEIHGDKRGYLFESYRKDLFTEQGLNLEFTREFDLILDGEVELWNSGYLIFAYKGRADIKVDGLEIEIDDVKKQMLYIDVGVKVRACGNGRMNVRYCE